MFKKRHKLGRRHSERSFTRGAQRVHSQNDRSGSPMRGGIRL